MESKDPAGHIKISVSDPEKGKRFYARLFDFLGYGLQRQNKEGQNTFTMLLGFIISALRQFQKHK